ncbi:MAG: hypothetical protein C3F02_04810 [Parcubacteria group bacterium]|nr:MAG: hypothetical protein C3F02_04810 [Parcubacteria group bacterium]
MSSMSMARLNNKKYWLLSLGIISFLLIYSFLVWSLWWPALSQNLPLIFNWPDENANYFFAQLFANQNALAWPEALNNLSQNLLRTRSMNVLPSGALVPMSFLPNIVIWGVFLKLIGRYLTLFLTPALAVATVWVVYKLIEHIFQDKVLARVTALLLSASAPWVYFANFSFLPTVLFIFLVSAGWLALAKSFIISKKSKLLWSVGVLLLSLAVVCRPTEIVWLAVILLFVLYFKRRELNKFKIFSGVLIFFVVSVAWLWLNKITYGSYWPLGYVNLQQAGEGSREILSKGKGLWSAIKLLFIPFGFNPLLILSNIYKYIFELIWPQFVFGLMGLYFIIRQIFIKKKYSLPWHKYLLLTPIVFIIILLYYGSWQLTDSMVRNLNTISISYVRYFMPLYILLLPLSAYALKKIFWQTSRAGQWSFYSLVVIIMASGLHLAFYAKNDGLLATQSTVLGYYQQFADVQKIAPAGSIIITAREDKIFFPYYKVIVGQEGLPLWPRLAPLLKDTPVYYYTDKDDVDLQSDRIEAGKQGLDFIEPVAIYNKFKLYKVINK